MLSIDFVLQQKRLHSLKGAWLQRTQDVMETTALNVTARFLLRSWEWESR